MLDAGAGYATYLWQDGSTNQRFNANAVGKYWVTVADNHKCVGSDTTQIQQIFPPPSNFITKDTSITCTARSLVLKPDIQFTTYLWSTGANTSQIYITRLGTYWLEVTDSKGCVGKEFINVTLQNCTDTIYFPNSFTPNNEGLNDLFKPGVYGVLEKYVLNIYNRFGQNIFETNDYTKGWNGTLKATPAYTGVFVWYCRYKFFGQNEHTVKGTVILLR